MKGYGTVQYSRGEDACKKLGLWLTRVPQNARWFGHGCIFGGGAELEFCWADERQEEEEEEQHEGTVSCKKKTKKKVSRKKAKTKKKAKWNKVTR